MKKFMMIALFALMAPLANAGDQAAKLPTRPLLTLQRKLTWRLVEVTEAAGTAADGTKVEAIEITEEAARHD